jgi:hypothetical protein
VLSVNRALQNPGLFTSDHYRQAAFAVAAGVAIRILVSVPVCVLHVLRNYIDNDKNRGPLATGGNIAFRTLDLAYYLQSLTMHI